MLVNKSTIEKWLITNWSSHSTLPATGLLGEFRSVHGGPKRLLIPGYGGQDIFYVEDGILLYKRCWGQ